MSDPFIGEIVMFGGNFAPRGWAFCSGQLLSISSNTALFSILGTTYGGDGRTTFALPDLRGRASVHPGNGPGLSPRRLGERFGTETVTLNDSQLPAHSHTATGQARCSDANGTTDKAKGNIWSEDLGVSSATYSSNAADALMAADSVEVTVENSGGGQGHNNIQPCLSVNYIIALNGTFPSRN
jgi:microcystin-dependent protein